MVNILQTIVLICVFAIECIMLYEYAKEKDIKKTAGVPKRCVNFILQGYNARKKQARNNY